MPALDLAVINPAIAAALEEVPGVRKAWPTPTEAVDTGEAVVGYPAAFELGVTFGAGGARTDTATIPVWFFCGLLEDAETLARVSAALGGGTQDAFKDALEGSDDLQELLSYLSVRRGGVERYVTRGDIKWVALRFDCEVMT